MRQDTEALEAARGRDHPLIVRVRGIGAGPRLRQEEPARRQAELPQTEDRQQAVVDRTEAEPADVLEKALAARAAIGIRDE